ncbi:Ecotin-like protein 1 [Leptomonas seymouri]|uniref:Ecotin-like protein 1 n=1 Tax=Leptomonas seymouri TaxID=5684 RepID=A0A0N1IIL0_LEPSE|nr:Ecotin-like protein 1 [Leptomonas seymouri]|eukprot:KPI84853.1 Ecotin-like protein 1 [Leptomonas seymouri]
MPFCKVDAQYPPAPHGEKRIIFALDPQGTDMEQQRLMLQLIPSRMLEVSKTDAINILDLNGKVERHTLEGSDAPYFHVELANEYAVARRGLGEGEDDGVKVKKLVPMAQPPMFPYSHAQPVVVYLPKDVELHYNVWFGGEVMKAASE